MCDTPMADETLRAAWIEQARQLREEQPEIWEAAGSELVDLADATTGDGLGCEPVHDRS